MLRGRLPGTTGPLVMLAALALLGCGKLREVKACRAAVAEVKPAFEEIRTLSKTPGFESQRRIAARYASLAKRLKPLAPATGEVGAALRDYAGVIESIDTAIRSHVDAQQAKQGARTTEARRELERLVRREKSAATRVDATCHG